MCLKRECRDANSINAVYSPFAQRYSGSEYKLSNMNLRRYTSEMALVEVLIQLETLTAAVWSGSATETSVFPLPISVLRPLVVGIKTQAALINFEHMWKQS